MEALNSNNESQLKIIDESQLSSTNARQRSSIDLSRIITDESLGSNPRQRQSNLSNLQLDDGYELTCNDGKQRPPNLQQLGRESLSCNDKRPGDSHPLLVEKAFNLIIENFPKEVIVSSTLSGKRGTNQLNEEKIKLIKKTALLAVNANDLDWKYSLAALQIKLRNHRKKLLKTA